MVPLLPSSVAWSGLRPRRKEVTVPLPWHTPEVADTVFSTPDDGCMTHETCRVTWQWINVYILLHRVGPLLTLYKPILMEFAFLDSKGGAFSKLNLLLIKSQMEFYIFFPKYLNIAKIRMVLLCLFVSRFNGRHSNTQDWSFLQNNAFTNVRLSYNTHAMNKGTKVDVSCCKVLTDSTTALPSQTFHVPVESVRKEATELQNTGFLPVDYLSVQRYLDKDEGIHFSETSLSDVNSHSTFQEACP